MKSDSVLSKPAGLSKELEMQLERIKGAIKMALFSASSAVQKVLLQCSAVCFQSDPGVMMKFNKKVSRKF